MSERGAYRRRLRSWQPSEAQRRVLDAVAESLANAEIAVRLGLSPETVRWHIGELLDLTGSGSREELASWWKGRRPAPIIWPFSFSRRRWTKALGLGAGMAVAAGIAVLAVSGRSGESPAAEEFAQPVVLATPSPVPEGSTAIPPPRVAPGYYEPFFMQAKTAGLAQTVRISGGDLPHPVVVPVVDYFATTNVFTDTRGAWWTTEGLPVPPEGSLRYRLEFVSAPPDLAEIPRAGHECWYVPRDPPVVGPGCAWTGYVQPDEFFDGMLQRYVTLGQAGVIGETPTLEEALIASQKLLGVSVHIPQTYLDGVTIPARDITDDDAIPLLEALGGSRLAMFGARGPNVTRSGPSVPIEIWFGGLRGPVLNYFVPGTLAPYGFLMARRHIGAWAPAGQGWFQRAFATPPELDVVMATLGYPGRQLANVDEYRMVPIGEGTGDWRRIASIQVWKSTYKAGNDPSQPRLSVAPPPGLCEDGCEAQFVDLGLLDQLDPACRVEIRPAGQEPFPEAVQPPVFRYYPPDEARPGILEDATGMMVANGSYGLSWPVYAPRELDHVLNTACLSLQ